MPNLDKKIIYLDQCALGFILRALMHKEGQTKEHPDQIPVVERFLRAFEKLDLLNKKQLLVCPRSDFHFKETALMTEERAEALNKVGVLLSSTFSFADPARIIVMQSLGHFRASLKGQGYKFDDDKKHSVRGSVDVWNSWINVHVKHKVTARDVQSLHDDKADNHAALAQQFARWRSLPKQGDEDFKIMEIKAVGSLVINLFSSKSLSIPEPNSMIELLLRSVMYPDQLQQFSAYYFKECEEASIPESERQGKIEEYFSGPALEVPFFQIACGLTALVGVRASQNKGMKVDANHIIDILFMALYLPYVDAMLMEKTWHKDLLTLPLTYKAEVYSVSNMDEFFSYLDEIEASAPPGFMKNVEAVYGEIQPYYTVHKPKN